MNSVKTSVKTMTKNIYGYGNPYNPDVLKDLDKIEKELDDKATGDQFSSSTLRKVKGDLEASE